MIAEATYNYSGAPWPRTTQSTHQPVADKDRWSLVIPAEKPPINDSSRKKDIIDLKPINPRSGTKLQQAYGRPKEHLHGWVQRKLDERDWKDVLQLNFWDRNVKSQIAEMIGMQEPWKRLVTQFSDTNKWKEHRNEHGELYIYQENWLFLQELRAYTHELPFRIGILEGKGRAIALSQLCIGRFFDSTTGIATDKTLLSKEYFKRFKVIGENSAKENNSFRDHLQKLMKGDINIDAFMRPSTIRFVSITSQHCDLRHAMKVLQAHSRNISTNKIDSNRPSPFDVIGDNLIRPLAESLSVNKFKYDPDFDSVYEPRPRLWEWKDPTMGPPSKDAGSTERDKYGIPIILDQDETKAYFDNPYDDEADINMRALLTTSARTPTYEETSAMTAKRNKIQCSPPFINSLSTLQVHPGAAMDKRINTSKANRIYIFAKVLYPIFLDYNRAPRMTEELRPQFHMMCRAYVYFIRSNNNPSTSFKIPHAIKSEDYYKDLGGKTWFKTEKLQMIATAMMITELLDVSLDHPIQHEDIKADTRVMARLDNDDGNSEPKLKWLMTPQAALTKTKERLKRLAAALSMLTRTSDIGTATLYHQISECAKISMSMPRCFIPRLTSIE